MSAFGLGLQSLRYHGLEWKFELFVGEQVSGVARVTLPTRAPRDTPLRRARCVRAPLALRVLVT